MTTRDQAWNAILHQLIEKGEFKMSDLPFDDRQHHTVRRVLRYMEDEGIVERESPQHKIWKLGPEGRELLNIRQETADGE
jgi:DNA-binding HxlR family transcriptional regulator